MEQFAATMQQHQLRLTAPRRKVFLGLLHSEAPQTLQELATAVSPIDRVTLHRTLQLLVSLGIVTIVPFGWKKRYELASPFHPHHHHHFECTNCGRLIDIHSATLEQTLHEIASENRFTISSHSLELRGQCSNCMQASTVKFI